MLYFPRKKNENFVLFSFMHVVACGCKKKNSNNDARMCSTFACVQLNGKRSGEKKIEKKRHCIQTDDECKRKKGQLRRRRRKMKNNSEIR